MPKGFPGIRQNLQSGKENIHNDPPPPPVGFPLITQKR